MSTADIELLADPFDTWVAFEKPLGEDVEPTVDEIMAEAARFDVNMSGAF